MPNSDNAKIEKELARLAATFFERESNRDALITVTRAEVGRGWKTATIFISVLPTEKEKAALDFLMRLRSELRTYIKEHMRSRAIPFMSVEIDQGEKARQHIDEISRKIEK